MALIKCADCGREVSRSAVSCPGCGRPIAAAPTAPSASPGLTWFVVLPVGLLSAIWYAATKPLTPTKSPSSGLDFSTPTFRGAGSPPPSEPTDAERQREKVRYERERDALRKAHPKTEDDVIKVMGRQPDDILDIPAVPPYQMLEWNYETKTDGRSVIVISVTNGKVTAMAL